MMVTPVSSSPASMARSIGAAPPAREQRRVHVQHLVLGQERFPDDRAVRADADDLGLGGGDRDARLIRVQVIGLEQLDPEQAGSLRRRAPHLAAAATRAVRRRHDQHGAVQGRRETVEHVGGERGRAEVDRLHRR